MWKLATNYMWAISMAVWIAVSVVLALLVTPWLWIAVGIVLVAGIFGIVSGAYYGTPRYRVRQVQNSGPGSVNYQAGRDLRSGDGLTLDD